MAAASSSLNRETVTLQLPSGEMIDADVPAGLSDEEINSRMRQQHPEFYPSQVSDAMRDQALKSIPKPGVQMDEHYLIGQEPMQPTGKHVLSEAIDLARGAATGVADVSAPVLAHRLLQQNKVIGPGDLYKGETDLKSLPDKAVMFLLPLLAGMPEGAAVKEGASQSLDQAAVARARTLQQAGAEGTQAAEAGQGVSQTVGARAPVEDALPLYQRLGIKTSPGFQMPPVREPVPIDAATQVRQKLGLEPQATPPASLSGESQFPPPSRIYRTQGEINPDTMETRGIQEMMRDRFARDEAVNEAEALKNQAAGYSMDTPKGVQADKFAKSQGRAPKPRQANEYGYKKPINQVQSFSDLTDLLRQSVKAANARKGKP